MSAAPTRRSVLTATVWAIAIRWTDRVIGLISTLILARLLVPEDFGLVAMALLVMAIIDACFDIGAATALIQDSRSDRAIFDTAWTLRILQQTAIAIVLVFISGWAAAYFREPRLQQIIWILAGIVVIGAFTNIGTVTLQKTLDFAAEFKLFIGPRLIGFATTLTLAWFLRSYWALIAGMFAARSATVIASYIMCSYRPRLQLSAFRSIWSFSQWNLIKGIASVLDQRTDKLVVGRSCGASILGAYTLADDIAMLPTSELLAPIGRVLFPTFALVKHDPKELKRLFLLAMGIQATLAIPAGIGVSIIAEQLILALLGENWIFAASFLTFMGVASAFMALAHASHYLLLAIGQVKRLAATVWVQFTLTIIAMSILPIATHPQLAAIARMIVVLVGLIVAYWFVTQAAKLVTYRDLITATWRPVLASAVMATMLTQMPATEILTPLTDVSLRILIGAAVYSLTLYAAWLWVGTPTGAESYLLSRVRMVQKRVAPASDRDAV